MDTSIILLIMAIGLFFLLREIFCWYFKINERRDILEEIRDGLKCQTKLNYPIQHSNDCQCCKDLPED